VPAVAEERSFTRAAARLHVVQSGVSAAIKALEHELDAALLERTSKRVALTDAGQALLPRARATLDAAAAARDAVGEVRAVGYGNRIVVDRAFAAAGVDRQVVIEVIDINSGAAFVGEGLGVAVLPRFAVPESLGVVLLPVTGADLDWPLGVATSAVRAPSAAARALLALIDDYVR
jgi:DNA-binding transcriptional LysR family regulator